MGKSHQSIVIIGAGEVGYHAAEVLLQEGYSITFIDISRERLAEVEESLDVGTLSGHGADPKLLLEAQIDRADLALAVTSNDELNLVSASTAKLLGARAVVARVRNPIYDDVSPISLRHHLGIDLLVSPEKLASFELAKFVDNPDILAFQHFARGRVEMQRIQLSKRSLVLQQPLADLPFEGVLVVLINRQGEMIIPTGRETLQPDDVITLVGESKQIELLQNLFHIPKESAPEGRLKIIIAGGGAVGSFLARTLESRNYRVTLIERDRTRADRLSERLHKVSVLNGDATRLAFMREERVGEADIFLATTGEDEDNLMACLLARDLGATRTGAVIRRHDYAELVEKIGIDVAVSPRQLTASQIVRLVRRSGTQTVTVIEGGAAEILEFIVGAQCSILDRTLKDIEFPSGTLLAVIARGDEVFVPKGSDVIKAGDHVIAFSLAKSIESLEALFGR